MGPSPDNIPLVSPGIPCLQDQIGGHCPSTFLCALGLAGAVAGLLPWTTEASFIRVPRRQCWVELLGNVSALLGSHGIPTITPGLLSNGTNGSFALRVSKGVTLYFLKNDTPSSPPTHTEVPQIDR